MRLDLYLKHLQLVNRRVLAKTMIDKNRVRVNDSLVKPSYEVKPNDRIDLYFKERIIKIRVLTPIENYETLLKPARAK